mgnify:CR=1 FL=1
MTIFIVEHRPEEQATRHIEIVSGVEDLDTSQYKDIMGIWVCDSSEEANAVISELYNLRRDQ